MVEFQRTVALLLQLRKVTTLLHSTVLAGIHQTRIYYCLPGKQSLVLQAMKEITVQLAESSLLMQHRSYAVTCVPQIPPPFW